MHIKAQRKHLLVEVKQYIKKVKKLHKIVKEFILILINLLSKLKMNYLKKKLSSLITWLIEDYFASSSTMRRFINQIQWQMRSNELKNHPNPILNKGIKYFSQNEEDGILLEILKRMKIFCGSFIEFGVGNGTENNSIILLMLGWRGAWIDICDLSFDTSKSSKLFFLKSKVTLSNTLTIYNKALNLLKLKDFDVLSIDLDGIDIYLIEWILFNGYRPKIFICEYNAKFPPPVKFRVPYSDNFEWDQESDFSGASLQSYVDLMNLYNYKLVACNITGSNCFFVSSEYEKNFTDIKLSLEDIFCPPNDGVLYTFNHKPSPKTIEQFI